MTALLGLYPGWWRDRYRDELEALLAEAPPRTRDRIDLVRGAFDSWLHPPRRSRLPALAALVGGGLWTVSAAAVAAQPAPPDWPGYLIEIVPLAGLAAACLLLAVLGVGLRAADAARRPTGLASVLAVIGFGAWLAALVGTVGGGVDGPTLAAGQTAAMIAIAMIGLVVGRAGSDIVGSLVLLAAGAMLVPWGPMWLVFGACWTALGILLFIERGGRAGERWGAA